MTRGGGSMHRQDRHRVRGYWELATTTPPLLSECVYLMTELPPVLQLPIPKAIKESHQPVLASGNIISLNIQLSDIFIVRLI